MNNRLPASFLSRMRITAEGCWIWLGHVSTRGHARYLTGSRTNGTRREVQAHHFAYEFLVGSICKGRVKSKTYGVKLCVNPEHLVVTKSRFRKSIFLKSRALCADGCVIANMKLGSVFDCLDCPLDECVLVVNDDRKTSVRR